MCPDYSKLISDTAIHTDTNMRRRDRQANRLGNLACPEQDKPDRRAVITNTRRKTNTDPYRNKHNLIHVYHIPQDGETD